MMNSTTEHSTTDCANHPCRGWMWWHTSLTESKTGISETYLFAAGLERYTVGT